MIERIIIGDREIRIRFESGEIQPRKEQNREEKYSILTEGSILRYYISKHF